MRGGKGSREALDVARGWEGELGGVGGRMGDGKGSREVLAAERGVGRDLLDGM